MASNGGHSMPNAGYLFSDQLVTATELNRHVGNVLDKALSKPVTITRNDQHFALLRREYVAQLSALSNQVSIYLEAMRAIRSLLSGKELNENHLYRWLYAYEADDLSLMQDELIEAIADVVHDDDLEAVEGVIYEWYESAIATKSEALDAAFEAESKPIPLTAPSNNREMVEV